MELCWFICVVLIGDVTVVGPWNIPLKQQTALKELTHGYTSSIYTHITFNKIRIRTYCKVELYLELIYIIITNLTKKKYASLKTEQVPSVQL